MDSYGCREGWIAREKWLDVIDNIVDDDRYMDNLQYNRHKNRESRGCLQADMDRVLTMNKTEI